MKRVVLLLLAFVLVPVLAFAQTENVAIDTPTPLLCGSGNVRISGTAIVYVSSPYPLLKVQFGVDGTNLPVVYSATIPNDSVWHGWSANVLVAQGSTYAIFVTLNTPSGTFGKSIL